ncbi:lysosomal alpha-mannosidase-like [Euwallacea fornicatus]|uniref:lysosomal alpha-mannosidase-like n=1 Tax=Euwallacea fornicatus TaxID=995702 RepID=UPI00338FDA66
MGLNGTVLSLLLGASAVLGFYINAKIGASKSCVKCHDVDPDKITVHMIHHSHDDVGWLKTVDQYYWGLNNSIQHIGYQYIVNSVINALDGYPDRRFIQVETAFFWMWWQHQDNVARSKFKKLVDNGQLEIINGAWSMNDEACVNYQSTIDLFTWGFKILNDTLGECGNPTIAWQIDPFGHSREHGSLMTKMGFDGLFFGRLDHNDRKVRKASKDMDFIWKASANDDSVIYGGAFGTDNTYHSPGGFCFDLLCSDDAIVDDPDDEGYNLDEKVFSFEEEVKKYASYYKTKNVIVTMGGDFYYQAADINFSNSDRLIKAFENHPDIKLIYSTPSCYLQAVYEAKPEMTTKTDDFLPYSNDDDTYWVGFYSSKPNFKLYERISHNVLQSAKHLNSLALASGQREVNVGSMDALKGASGVVQHHDAITGTEKQHVNFDYLKMLTKGINEAEAPFASIIRNLLGKSSDFPELSSCLLVNVSICTVAQASDEVLVVVYNPLSWPVDHVVRVPIDGGSYSVSGPKGDMIFDVVVPISDFSYVLLDDMKPGKYEVVFVASQVPPMGINSYLLKKESDEPSEQKSADADDFKFGDENLGFELDSSTNLLRSVTMNGKTVEITQNFFYYTSKDGSGAYIFKPEGDAISFDNPTIERIFKGEVVEEVQQRFNNWTTQIIRIYKQGVHNYIEFDWLVGPVDVPNDTGKEIITRFTVNEFANEKTFYTDSNGREMIERIMNYRPTFEFDPAKQPIASNYFPVTSKITIKDKEQKLQVSVLNDRSQGGTSLDQGQIELMIHRRTMREDRKGVGESLDEYEFGHGVVVRGQHYLVLGSTEAIENVTSATAQERILAQQKLLRPWIGFGNASGKNLTEVVRKQFSGLKEKLPENINVLSLEPRTDTTHILRLEHILEKNEDSSLSQEVTVDITELFAEYTVENPVEMVLGANRQLESLDTYDWSYTGNLKPAKRERLNANAIKLAPMDIRTFVVELKKRN